jgi:hypothetical protein
VHPAENFLDAGEKTGGMDSLQQLGQILFESPELGEVLLHSELSSELGQELRLPRIFHSGSIELRLDQGETGVDQGLTQDDLASDVVVAARIRDAAPQDRARLPQDDRLGGGRSKIDPDVVVHAASPPPKRFCSII